MCPSDSKLQALRSGQLDAAEAATLQVHVDECPRCQGLEQTATPLPSPVTSAAALEDTAHPGAGPPSPAPQPAQTWEPPERFEEYRLVNELGRGAMGQVYLYRDVFLDRLVAIKFLTLTDPAARERFVVEARAIARLSHPNVVAVHRVGEVASRPFLVAEYIRGSSLDRSPKPAPWREVLHIGIALARGLGAAHRCGVLHRDIKPANAILAEDGVVKLLDFGLAQVGQGQGQGQEPGVAASLDLRHRPDERGLVGTPVYIAPEIWQDQPATRRTDIYSLGSLLYDLCCGHPPHSGRSILELYRAVVGGDAPPVAQQVPDVDPAFAAIIDRCLRRDPLERPASCEELCHVLEALTERQRETAAPIGNPYRGLRPFEAEHRAVFFGRTAEVREAVERLRSEPLLVLAGDSGVGKSSLCRAGIVPSLCEGALGDGRSWTAVCLVPGRRPLAALVDALAPVLAQAEEKVAALLRSEPGALARALRQQLGEHGGLVLFIDQLEELVTQSVRAEAEGFCEILGQFTVLVPGVRVLMTLRGDFVTRLAVLRGLGRELERALSIIRPLGEAALREAIVAPAARLGFSFESDAMVDELVRATEQAEGGLPLLQFALAELWRTRDQERRCIAAAALQSVGGVSGALARHADEVIDHLAVPEREAARRLLLRLVAPDGTRTIRTLGELLGEHDHAGRAALEELVRGRLLVGREGEGEQASYEIAHEALVAGWGTLRGWLAQDAEGRVVLERLDRAAADWARQGRGGEGLWSERQLGELSPGALAHLSVQEAAFVSASQRQAWRRRWVRRGVALAVPVVLSLAYGGVRLKARRELNRQVTAHLSAAAGHRAEAQRLQARLTEVRRQALARFDGRDEDAGERLWKEGLVLFPQVENSFRQAARAAEAGLVLDQSSAAARQQLAEVLYEQALLLEGESRPADQEDLIRRAATYDRAVEERWGAPARLALRTNPPGAQVTVQRYRLPAAGPAALEALTSGVTPLQQLELKPGSYLLSISAPGRAPLRYPLLAARGERLELTVDLPAAGAVPAGFVYVPAGRFLFGGENETLRYLYASVQPQHVVSTGSYLIGRTEVTFSDWMQFLRAVPPGERVLLNVTRPGRRLELRQLADGRFELSLQPTAQQRLYVLKEGERLLYPGRSTRQAQDWGRMPVAGVTHADAQRYLRWLDQSGRVPGARLCTEHEWERAARGADGRAYPSGAQLERDDANLDETYGRNPQGFGPDEVASHPGLESPLGVADLVGNVWEWTESVARSGELVYRGGGWYQGQASARSINRQVGDATLHDIDLGFRVCASVRIQ